MLFTWDTTNLCIVFESWHVRSTAGLIFSLLSVILIGMGYEALRAGTRRYEILVNRRVEAAPSEYKQTPVDPYTHRKIVWKKKRKKKKKKRHRTSRLWFVGTATGCLISYFHSRVRNKHSPSISQTIPNVL